MKTKGFFSFKIINIRPFLYQKHIVQPVSYKRYFRCNNCYLLLVYTIHLSLRTDLVDPPPMGTIYMKHALYVSIHECKKNCIKSLCLLAAKGGGEGVETLYRTLPLII